MIAKTIRTIACKSRRLTLQCFVERTALIAASVALSCQSVHAEEPYDGSVPFVPEAMVTPLKNNADLDNPVGWLLVYRNQVTIPENTIVKVQSQTVKYKDRKDGFNEGKISWSIERSTNSSCLDHKGGPCPDEIRVLSVPVGFVAIPESAVVSERAKQVIFIVPAEFG